MKKIFFIITTFIIIGVINFTSISTVTAQADNSNQSLDAQLKDVLATQNITEISKINCAQVTDEQFAKLGDAYMEQIHPGAQHEYMDKMMGGEGSTSLQAVHIRMGQAYLGCGSSCPAGAMMGGGYGMMGSGMMGGYYLNNGAGFNSTFNSNEKGGVYSMMGFPFMSWGFGWGWLIMVLFWILVIMGIIWLVKLSTTKNNGQSKPLDALEILKTRYAKGEIGQEEFEEKKKNLTN